MRKNASKISRIVFLFSAFFRPATGASPLACRAFAGFPSISIPHRNRTFRTLVAFPALPACNRPAALRAPRKTAQKTAQHLFFLFCRACTFLPRRKAVPFAAFASRCAVPMPRPVARKVSKMGRGGAKENRALCRGRAETHAPSRRGVKIGPGTKRKGTKKPRLPKGTVAQENKALKRPLFARLRRQSALTTTKVPAALFLALPSKSPVF